MIPESDIHECHISNSISVVHDINVVPVCLFQAQTCIQLAQHECGFHKGKNPLSQSRLSINSVLQVLLVSHCVHAPFKSLVTNLYVILEFITNFTFSEA